MAPNASAKHSRTPKPAEHDLHPYGRLTVHFLLACPCLRYTRIQEGVSYNPLGPNPPPTDYAVGVTIGEGPGNFATLVNRVDVSVDPV